MTNRTPPSRPSRILNIGASVALIFTPAISLMVAAKFHLLPANGYMQLFSGIAIPVIGLATLAIARLMGGDHYDLLVQSIEDGTKLDAKLVYVLVLAGSLIFVVLGLKSVT